MLLSSNAAGNGGEDVRVRGSMNTRHYGWLITGEKYFWVVIVETLADVVEISVLLVTILEYQILFNCRGYEYATSIDIFHFFFRIIRNNIRRLYDNFIILLKERKFLGKLQSLMNFNASLDINILGNGISRNI